LKNFETDAIQAGGGNLKAGRLRNVAAIYEAFAGSFTRGH